MNPKISVIIPVYNTEKYLSRCFDSVINQTLRNIEIIIINDGSTDNSLDIINRYQQNDKRIIVINQKNTGQGGARNRGLDIAKGEYISFIDSDDFIPENFLELLVQKESPITVANEVSIISSKIQYIHPNNMVKFHRHQTFITNQLYIIKAILLLKIPGAMCNKLFKRYLFDNIRYPSGFYEDKIFLIEIILKNNIQSMEFELGTVYYHYENLESTTRQKLNKKMIIDFIQNQLLGVFNVLKKYNIHLILEQDYYTFQLMTTYSCILSKLNFTNKEHLKLYRYFMIQQNTINVPIKFDFKSLLLIFNFSIKTNQKIKLFIKYFLLKCDTKISYKLLEFFKK